jgi:hypothetical protein
MGELKLHYRHAAPRVQTQPNFGILTTVTDLARHHFIYVWHQIKKGDELSLIHDHRNPVNPWAIEVYYKGFMIGYLQETCGRIAARLIQQGAPVKAIVKCDQINAYRPFEGIEIELRACLPAPSTVR